MSNFHPIHWKISDWWGSGYTYRKITTMLNCSSEGQTPKNHIFEYVSSVFLHLLQQMLLLSFLRKASSWLVQTLFCLNPNCLSVVVVCVLSSSCSFTRTWTSLITTTTQPRTNVASSPNTPPMSCARGSSSTSGWVCVQHISACLTLKSLKRKHWVISSSAAAPVSHRGREETDRHSDEPDAPAGQQLVSSGVSLDYL